MKVIKGTLVDQSLYRFGHIYRFRFITDDPDVIVGESIIRKQELSQEKLDAHIQARIPNIEYDLNNPVQPERTEEEIIALLVGKELLIEGQTLDDLKTKAEIIVDVR